MIGHHENWIRNRKRLSMISTGSAATAAVFTILGLVKSDLFQNQIALQTILNFAHDSEKTVITVCGAIIVIVEYLKKNYGPPEIWAVVHAILDEMHSLVFTSQCNLAENRITLFKVQSWYFRLFCLPPWKHFPPWGIWLVPVERSNYLTRNSKAVFRVKDDGGAEGVAGQSYVQRSVIHVDNLPNISPDNGNTHTRKRGFKGLMCKWFHKEKYLSEEELKILRHYAKSTWSTEKRVILNAVAGKSMPRTLCGLPVEVHGEIWGVIVVDSRSEKLIGKEQILLFYDKHAFVLSKLLKYTK
jgi:hypothetical protein